MHRNAHTPLPPATVIGPFHVEFCRPNDDRLAEYQLRHAIFVTERHWLDDHGTACEHDGFDPASCAVFLRDWRTGTPAACQRFILPEHLGPGVRTKVETMVDHTRLDLASLPRGAWAEVSRSTIAPQYRWGSTRTEMPAMPAIKLASIAVAIALGRRLLLSVSDPRTARLTHRMGFSIYQVGPVMEYHGSRAAYRIDVDEVVSGMTLDAQDHLHQLVDAAKRRLTGLNSQGGDGTWCL